MQDGEKQRRNGARSSLSMYPVAQFRCLFGEAFCVLLSEVARVDNHLRSCKLRVSSICYA